MSLRSRLLIALLSLVAAALLTAAVAIYAAQRSFLYSRLDQRVVAAAAPMSYALGLDARLLDPAPHDAERPGVGRALPSPLGRGLAAFVPAGTFSEFLDGAGHVLRGPIVASYGERPPPRPALTRRMLTLQPPVAPVLFTVGSAPRSRIRFRVAAVGLSSGTGTLIVAVPLREVDQTLDRLILVEALVAAGVLIVLVGVGWAVIRFALRPLDTIARIADEITEGDLSRRVSPSNRRTEVGRLGRSLNRMLVRIEEAFDDRARAEERRRQFLADASHELRTPLASIRGYAELFRLGAVRDRRALARAMERIESEAARMGVLVDDLLLLARLDELPAAPRTRIDLTALVEHRVNDARATAPDRPIVFEAADAVEVFGDADGIGQVIANLLTNALIHTPPDARVRVTVGLRDGEAIVTVEDEGPGIPPGTEEQVFERFWRADGGRARGPGGSGLGLSIVREIVANHHGSVLAGPRPGGGAVFTVRLPAAPDAGPHRDSGNSQPSLGAHSESPAIVAGHEGRARST